jgi:hypothetical protein
VTSPRTAQLEKYHRLAVYTARSGSRYTAASATIAWELCHVSSRHSTVEPRWADAAHRRNKPDRARTVSVFRLIVGGRPSVCDFRGPPARSRWLSSLPLSPSYGTAGQGFQWLDGSFLEDIEAIEGRPPNDLDVVTFFRLPAGVTQAQVRASAPDAFPITGPERIVFKGVFHVDPYFVDLSAPAERLVAESAYWYSMWSHRRDARWKGYLQINLSPAEDGIANSHLITATSPGGAP